MLLMLDKHFTMLTVYADNLRTFCGAIRFQQAHHENKYRYIYINTLYDSPNSYVHLYVYR